MLLPATSPVVSLEVRQAMPRLSANVDGGVITTYRARAGPNSSPLG